LIFIYNKQSIILDIYNKPFCNRFLCWSSCSPSRRSV
jgi:hypothetical protein